MKELVGISSNLFSFSSANFKYFSNFSPVYTFIAIGISISESNITPFILFNISVSFSSNNSLYVYTILVHPRLCPCKYISLYPNSFNFSIAPTISSYDSNTSSYAVPANCFSFFPFIFLLIYFTISLPLLLKQK